ncbi:MAG: 2-amino-4-hydroxy-6-hydroxymethyldihydropteridine diphosphokinase [Eubacteriaceae bacterium]|nr:2-amino-4-hydroxy-6-hydroxymethyldihydropteridine diphosphokinase [Eubacteriaceae bacterium]
MKKIYLSLGSNVGNTMENLEKAVEVLRQHVNISQISSYYETEPVGYKDQEWFLNIVLEGETELEPMELLSFCQGIERGLKRVKTIRFGPRSIDVDILLYEGYESESEILTVPHPRMLERAFVMVPLCEIAPELEIKGRRACDILSSLKGEEVRLRKDL